ncbi:hypothetical protein CHS0354_019918 [Potamilus streckersoni]|uniref:Uncharacterized protein n=1 Tax=Potamilus streckersoni TaxID=2493646 RepID=A0AAE0VYU7_9BIVA|nr:hypothetical protein CHS0354_019918 [Potamilus streckersoni]
MPNGGPPVAGEEIRCLPNGGRGLDFNLQKGKRPYLEELWSKVLKLHIATCWGLTTVYTNVRVLRVTEDDAKKITPFLILRDICLKPSIRDVNTTAIALDAEPPATCSENSISHTAKTT